MSSSARPATGAARPRVLGDASSSGEAFGGWALDDLAHGGAFHAHDAAADAGDALTSAERDAIALEQVAADAYARGYEEGRVTGEVAEGARLRTAVEAAERALAEIQAGEPAWQGAVEENVCALAIAVARQLVGQAVAIDPGITVDLVRRALAEVPVDQPIVIRVNPQDLATMSGRGVAGGDGPVTANREARWVADALVAPGGCVVEGRDRIVDGRVDTALERIWRRLTYSNA